MRLGCSRSRGRQRRGLEVHAPGRLPRAANWQAEAEHLGSVLPAGPVTVLGASKMAARRRYGWPCLRLVSRLLPAWPATAADPVMDAHARQHLAALGADAQTIRLLLAGATLRGVTDTELTSLTMSAALVPAVPPNCANQRCTVDALPRLLPCARELPGCPESVSAAFSAHKDEFLDNVAAFTKS